MPKKILDPVVEHYPLDGGFLVVDHMPQDLHQFFDNCESYVNGKHTCDLPALFLQQDPSSKLGDVFTGQKLDFIHEIALKVIQGEKFKDDYAEYKGHIAISLDNVGSPYHLVSLFSNINGIEVEVKQGFLSDSGTLFISGSVQDVLQTMNNMYISQEKLQTFRLDSYSRKCFTFAFWVTQYDSDTYMNRQINTVNEKLFNSCFNRYEVMRFEIPFG